MIKRGKKVDKLWTRKEEEEVLRLRKSGIPIPEICMILNRTRDSIQGKLTYLGYGEKRGARNKRLTMITLRCLKSNLGNDEEIAYVVGCSRSFVTGVRKRHGIPRRVSASESSKTAVLTRWSKYYYQKDPEQWKAWWESKIGKCDCRV